MWTWNQIHLFISQFLLSRACCCHNLCSFFWLGSSHCFNSLLFISLYLLCLSPFFPSGSSRGLVSSLFLFHSLWVCLPPLCECKTDFKPSPSCSSSISLFCVVSFSLSLWLSSVWTHDCRNVHTFSQTHGKICVCLCLNVCERRKEKETWDKNVTVFLCVCTVAKTGAGHWVCRK